MDAVSTHYHIVVTGLAVTETDPDPAIVLGQCCERNTQSMRYCGCTSKQRLLQPNAGSAQTRTYVAPEFSKIGVAEQFPLLIKESPAAEHCSIPSDSFSEAQSSQDPHAIGGQIDARPDRRPRWVAFDELWSVALTMQGRRQGQAPYTTSNDQDPINFSHRILLSCASSRCFSPAKPAKPFGSSLTLAPCGGMV
jgi:hypothetical protein